MSLEDARKDLAEANSLLAEAKQVRAGACGEQLASTLAKQLGEELASTLFGDELASTPVLGAFVEAQRGPVRPRHDRRTTKRADAMPWGRPPCADFGARFYQFDQNVVRR
jgi:hypothetical protein